MKKTVELIVVTLAILAIFQLFQLPGRQQEKQVREALDLITAPAETAIAENRIRLLLDEDEPETTFRTFAPVTVYSPIVAEVEPVEAVLAEVVGAVTPAPTAEAVPVAETESVITVPATDVPLLLNTVEVPAERVRAEEAAIGAIAPAPAQTYADPAPAHAVPLTEKPRTAAMKRRDEVFNLLDNAAQQGISSYNALAAYVKEQSGQGTSRSTIQAWKKAREVAAVTEAIANG